MEQNIPSPLPPQSNPLPPQQQGNNVLMPILVTILIVAALVGGGMFFWQQNTSKNQVADFKTQLNVLQIENQALKTQIQTLEKTASEAAAQKEEIEKKTCKGVWKNGACMKSTCVDSDVNEKPNDIYIKGTVTKTNENGVATVTTDECTGSKTQVNEMWCYESPAGSGNYVPGKMVSNCPKGCLDGACIK
jgi:regulator of replication initiation timing